jgi:hypothetical protein
MKIGITFYNTPLVVEGVYVPKSDEFGDTAVFEIDKVFHNYTDVTNLLTSLGDYVDNKLMENSTIKGVNIFEDLEQRVLEQIIINNIKK